MDARNTTIGLDELLAQSTWIRGLARSLVRDPALADDVAQDAWLAALEHAPREPHDLRGWLARVVRNAARQRARSEGARARREASAGERGEEPTPEELVSRVELHRELSGLVAALAEPYRATLVLRYYEGLSSAEIARRQGVPAGTVRWRLKQAVDELRAKLDERHGGERSAWAAALVALAGEAPRASVPAALSSLLALRWIAAAALVLALGWIGWRAANGGERDAATGIAALEQDEQGATRAAPDDTAAAERERAGRAALAGGAERLALRVVRDATGEPAPRARVLVIDAAEWDAERQRRIPRAAQLDPLVLYETQATAYACDEFGELSLAWGGAGGSLLAESDGEYAHASIEPGAPEPLTLRLTRELRVQVVDVQGRPLAGVPVEVRASMPDGEDITLLARETAGPEAVAPFPFLASYRVDGEAPDLSARLGVIGLAEGEVELEPANPPAEPVVLRLGPSAPVEVRTVDAQGELLALEGQAELTVPGRSWSGAEPTMHAELRAGRARFAAVGLRWDLAAQVELPSRGTSWTARSRGARAEGELLVIELVAPDRPALTGRALGADGAPLRELELNLSINALDGDQLARPRLETDSEGRFHVEVDEKVAEAGTVRASLLRYEGGWRLRGDCPTPIAIAPVDLALGDVVLRPIETRLAGRCVDAGGAPVAGLRLSVPQELEDSSYSSRTDAEGRFDFDCLLPASFDVMIRDEEWVPVGSTRARPGVLDLELVVARGGRVAGSVASPDSSDLDFLALVVEPHESHPLHGTLFTRSGRADRADGSFVATGLLAGRYRCRLVRRGTTLLELSDVAVALGQEVRPHELQGVELESLLEPLVLRVRSSDLAREIDRFHAAAFRDDEQVATELGRGGEVVLRIAGPAPTRVFVSALEHRPRMLETFESGVEVVLEPGLGVRLRGDRLLELEQGERRASLSLRLVGGDPRWPQSAREVQLLPRLARGEEVEALLPGPGRYVLCASVSQSAGNGLSTAGVAEPVGEPFAVEVREEDAGALLLLPLPESVVE